MQSRMWGSNSALRGKSRRWGLGGRVLVNGSGWNRVKRIEMSVSWGDGIWHISSPDDPFSIPHPSSGRIGSVVLDLGGSWDTMISSVGNSRRCFIGSRSRIVCWAVMYSSKSRGSMTSTMCWAARVVPLPPYRWGLIPWGVEKVINSFRVCIMYRDNGQKAERPSHLESVINNLKSTGVYNGIGVERWLGLSGP